MEVDNLISSFAGYSESYKFYNNEVEIIYDKEEHEYLLVTEGGLVSQPSVTTIVKKALDKSEILLPWACKMLVEKALGIVEVTGLPCTYEELSNLLNSSKKAHKEKLEDAGNVGSIAHNWIEQYIKKQLDGSLPKGARPLFPTDSRAWNACKAMLDWEEKHAVRWVSTEAKIYSRIHHYAGTMDGLAYTDSCNDPLCCPKPFKDRLSLIDWKTSNDLYLDYLFQVSAYWGAYTEMEATEHPHGPLIEDGWVIRLGKEDGEFDPWHIWDIPEMEMYYYGFLNARRWFSSVESAKEQVKLKNNMLRDARKEQKRIVKEAELKLKCKSADKYKAVRRPTCNSGMPCETCTNKWNDLHPLDKIDRM